MQDAIELIVQRDLTLRISLISPPAEIDRLRAELKAKEEQQEQAGEASEHA